MTRTLFSLSLAALLSLGTASVAQDAATTTPAAEAEAAEVATPDTAAPEAAPAASEAQADETATTPEDLNMGVTLGETGSQELQPGQPYIREEFESWALRCLKAPEGEEDPCQLYQLLYDDSGNAVAEISMFPLEGAGDAKAGATIVVPLETLLTQPLTIAVDNGQPRAYPYSFCNRAGCIARVGFSAADLNSFKAGAEAAMTLAPAAAPDQRVTLRIALNGFTAGINATDPQ